MNYKEFASLVPKETVEFVNNAISLAVYQSVDESDFINDFLRYSILLNAGEVSNSTINAAKKKKCNYEHLFEIIKKNLLLYTDECKYLTLYPVDVLSHIKDVNSSYYHSILNLYGVDSDSLIRNARERDKKALLHNNGELDSEIVSKLQPDVYILFKTASKIRNCLLRRDSGFKYGNTGVEAYSLILALYYLDSPVAKDIVAYFNSKGLSLNAFDKSTSLDMRKTTILSLPDDINVIKMYYMEYDRKLGENYDFADVISLAFDNAFTRSGVIDTFLSNYGLNSNDFGDLKNKLLASKEEREYAEQKKQTTEFYSKFDRQTIDFIKLVFKIYTIIMNNLSNCNNEVIKGSDDADTLSILIASYYYNGEVSNYFIDHGIKLENILEFLKLKIDDESLNKTEVDELKLIGIFKRFINDGVNKNASKIDYNAIIANLCNRDFNKSFILEEIFANFNAETLASDFSSNLKEHFNNKEKQRINYVRNALFKDLDYDVIQILERASVYYQGLKYLSKKSNINSINGMKDEDFVSLSILYASGYFENIELTSYLESINLRHNNLVSVFNNYRINDLSSDIDVINDKFSHIIFGGVNSSKKREEITVVSLLANAFDEKVYSSIELRDYLHEYNADYDTFSNLQEKIDTYKKEKIDKVEQEKYYQDFKYSFKDYDSIKLFAFSINIYERLCTIKNISDEDRKYFSLLIALLRTDSVVIKYFNKNDLSEELILERLGANKELLSSVSDKADFRKYELYFKNYLADFMKNNNEIDIYHIRQYLMNKENKLFMDICGNNYFRVFAEVTKNTDYEKSLTLSQKAALLRDEEVSDINIDNMTSLVSYGSNLVNYSRDLQSVSYSSSSENPLLEITNIIQRVKPKEVKKYKGFFGTKEVIETVPGEEVTPEIIEELTSRINSALDGLRKDIINYAEVIEYIKVYIIKINEHIAKVERALEEAQKRYNEASDELEKYQYKLIIDNLMSMRTNLKNSIVVWKQEQLKYLQLSSNHFMNINSLTLTRDSLLPLISSESLLNKGLISESDSLKLQSSIFGILDSLVSNNSAQAQDNLNQMRQLALPADLMSSIESTIDGQIRESDTLKLELK